MRACQLVGHLGIGLVAVGDLHVEIGLLHRLGAHRPIGQARRVAHQVVHHHRPVLRLLHHLDRAVVLLLRRPRPWCRRRPECSVDTRSARVSLPSSISIMAATVTIGLVIEAMRKMVSLVIATLASLSRKPIGLEHHDLAVARDQHDGARQLVVLHALVEPVAEVACSRVDEEAHLLRRLRLGNALRAGRSTPAPATLHAPRRPYETSTLTSPPETFGRIKAKRPRSCEV